MSYRLSVFSAVIMLPLAVVGVAQQLKIKEDQGHISPVRAKITFANEEIRDVVISGMGTEILDRFHTHVFFLRTEGGSSKRRVWIDQIKAIRNLSPRPRSEFTVDLKDGSSFDALFVGPGVHVDCSEFSDLGDAQNACSFLLITNPDESVEKIDMIKLKSVEFYPLPRKDKANNFMFDTWRYSPFTGEKLPQP